MIIGKCPVCGADMRVGSDMTNGDRFRAMTDEELAEWFWKNDWIYLKTKKEMLDWLKQEVSE